MSISSKGNTPDHPREYGENPMQPARLGVATGSSPRIRGELARLFVPPAAPGIIPANTGRISA